MVYVKVFEVATLDYHRDWIVGDLRHEHVCARNNGIFWAQSC